MSPLFAATLEPPSRSQPMDYQPPYITKSIKSKQEDVHPIPKKSNKNRFDELVNQNEDHKESLKQVPRLLQPQTSQIRTNTVHQNDDSEVEPKGQPTQSLDDAVRAKIAELGTEPTDTKAELVDNTDTVSEEDQTEGSDGEPRTEGNILDILSAFENGFSMKVPEHKHREGELKQLHDEASTTKELEEAVEADSTPNEEDLQQEHDEQSDAASVVKVDPIKEIGVPTDDEKTNHEEKALVTAFKNGKFDAKRHHQQHESSHFDTEIAIPPHLKREDNPLYDVHHDAGLHDVSPEKWLHKQQVQEEELNKQRGIQRMREDMEDFGFSDARIRGIIGMDENKRNRDVIGQASSRFNYHATDGLHSSQRNSDRFHAWDQRPRSGLLAHPTPRQNGYADQQSGDYRSHERLRHNRRSEYGSEFVSSRRGLLVDRAVVMGAAEDLASMQLSKSDKEYLMDVLRKKMR